MAETILAEFERYLDAYRAAVLADEAAWPHKDGDPDVDRAWEIVNALGTAFRERITDGEYAMEVLTALADAHLGIEAITMDDQDGEPTRHLWCVEGTDASCIMPTFCEAIERAKEKGYLPITPLVPPEGR